MPPAEPRTQGPAGKDRPDRAWASAGQALLAALAARLRDPLGAAPRPNGPDRPGRAWPAETAHALDLQAPLPQAGRAAEAVLAQALPALLDGLPPPDHPQALAHITAPVDPVAVLGSLLAAGLQANLGLRRMAGLACAIEAQTLAWLAELVGAPALRGGLLLGGGSAAGQTAVWAALARACPGWREDGLGPRGGQLVAYTSAASHHWLDRALRLAGLGTRGLRRLPVDAGQRLQPAVLARALAEDRRAGRIPWLLVAHAGTVGSGAVDPLAALAALARREDLWLHVDGAYGAPYAALRAEPDGAARLASCGAADLADPAGLDQADSLALDPHKALHQPLGCGALLLREPEALPAAFADAPPYYADAESGPDPDPAQCGPENSRPFRALPLWLSLQAAGAGGLRASLRAELDGAAALRAALHASPAFVCGPGALGVQTFRPRAGGEDAVGRLLARLRADGHAALSAVRLAGPGASHPAPEAPRWLRACVMQGRGSATDRLARLPAELAARLAPGGVGD